MSDKEGSYSRSYEQELRMSSGAKAHSPIKAGSRSRSHSRSYSRSRSRSPARRYTKSRSRSRSRRRYTRSRSRSPYSKRRRPSSKYDKRPSGRYRSHSRSPMSSRRRHQGNRDNPKVSNCLGIFGLSLYTQERELKDVFGRYGQIEEINVVYDHQSGRSRGFCFIYFRNVEDAEEAKERCTGMEIDGRRIRIDYSITERAHTPTPGIYLGQPTSGYRSNKRSPSPYQDGREGGRRDSGRRDSGRRGSYSRSRSRDRSYTPRRY